MAPGETEWGAKGDDDELTREQSRSPKTGLHSLGVVRGGAFGPWGVTEIRPHGIIKMVVGVLAY